MRLAPLLLAIAVSGLGCSLARGVLEPRHPFDAGVEDDARIGDNDAGEADMGSDVGMDDAGPCVERCDGTTAVTCNLGHEVRTVCATTVCDASGTYPMCLPVVCTPDMGTCGADGTMLTSCSHLGTMMATTHCDRGCTSGACRPQVTCSVAIAGSISMSGTMTIDLCGQLNDNNDASSHGDCPSATANGEDVIYRLDVDRTLHVMITETDVDPVHAVDPIVYLRSACAMRSSEIDCNDNGAATSAMLNEVLMAGEYFLVVDSFNDPGHTQCGQVSVTVATSVL